jgi:GNAT superfamily N-acetyltransferase
MGLQTLPPGEIAAVVTYLDMQAPPTPSPLPTSPLRLTRWKPVDLGKYRILFERVGGPWLWFSRLAINDTELAAIVNSPAIEVYAVEDRGGIEVGMLELDFREPGDCELGYIGMVPVLTGKGFGNWLMAQALNLAWRGSVTRVHLHTCTLDHPGALSFYKRSGFVPRGRAIETFPDPRLSGLLPEESAPHVPLLKS